MYTWVWRLTPHPHLPLFDGPDGVTACTRRDRSNVPLQSLTLLNDPTFVEAARSVAARITPGAGTDRERIRKLTRLCLSRDPTIVETRVLTELADRQRTAFAECPRDAQLVVGDVPPRAIEPVELATWVVVSRVIMNLDEFITRE